jgi:hypothetical protein
LDAGGCWSSGVDGRLSLGAGGRCVCLAGCAVPGAPIGVGLAGRCVLSGGGAEVVFCAVCEEVAALDCGCWVVGVVVALLPPRGGGLRGAGAPMAAGEVEDFRFGDAVRSGGGSC